MLAIGTKQMCISKVELSCFFFLKVRRRKQVIWNLISKNTNFKKNKGSHLIVSRKVSVSLHIDK